MKQRTKRFLTTACLSVAVCVISACNSGGSPGDPSTPENPTMDVGTLTVTNAPTSIGSSFVATTNKTVAKINGNVLSVGWGEQATADNSHIETITVAFDLTTGQVTAIFSVLDGGVIVNWGCADSAGSTAACSKVTVDKTAGAVTFASQVLTTLGGSSAPHITLSGTLQFTPPGDITPTPTPWPGTSTPKGNNGALLSGGAVIGKGTTAVSDLRKQLTVTVLGTHPAFTVGTAYATRPSTSTDYAYIFLSVTNIESQTLCFVKLGGITYRDASDVALYSNGLTYVQGSVAKLPSGSFTNTCLAPSETGMMATVTANIYAAVTKMEFTLDSAAFTVSSPVASVIPQSYTLQPAADPFYAGVLAIPAVNSGSGSALVGAQNRFHSWFLLDDAGQPLAYGLTDTAAPSVIAANGTATITDDVWYDGSGGSKLLVFVNFEDTSLPASLRQTVGIAAPASEICSAILPTDELMLCRQESRDLRLESLKSTYDAQGSTP